MAEHDDDDEIQTRGADAGHPPSDKTSLAEAISQELEREPAADELAGEGFSSFEEVGGGAPAPKPAAEGDQPAGGAEGDQPAGGAQGDQPAGEGLIDPWKQPEAARDPNAPPSDDELCQEPEGLKDAKEETRQRFQQVTARLKERSQELEQIRPQYEQLQRTVQSFNAQAPDLDRLARFSRALSSGTPEGLQYCWQEMEQYRAAIAKKLGVPTDTVDPLEDHPDLKDQVDKAYMTREAAIKVAGERQQHRLTAEATTRERQQHQYQAVIAETSQTMNTVESAWLQDPAYTAPIFRGRDGSPTTLRDLMGEHLQACTREFMRDRRDPRQIPQVMQRVYQQLRQQVPPTWQPAAAPPQGAPMSQAPGGGYQRMDPDPQPMRGSPAAGGRGRRSEPMSTYDAITQELGMT